MAMLAKEGNSYVCETYLIPGWVLNSALLTWMFQSFGISAKVNISHYQHTQ